MEEIDSVLDTCDEKHLKGQRARARLFAGRVRELLFDGMRVVNYAAGPCARVGLEAHFG